MRWFRTRWDEAAHSGVRRRKSLSAKGACFQCAKNACFGLAISRRESDCHSEERSDEESAFFFSFYKSKLLPPRGITRSDLLDHCARCMYVASDVLTFTLSPLLMNGGT